MKKSNTHWARFFLVALTLFVICLASAQGASDEAKALRAEARQALENNPNLSHNPVTLLVKFNRFATEHQRGLVRAQARAVKLEEFSHLEGVEVLGTRMGVEKAVEILNRQPWVEYAELDYTVHASVIPNDTHFGVLWGLHNTGQSGGVVDADIDAPEAWDLYTGSSDVVVAVIDTGIQRSHPDLVDNMWTNADEIAANGVDDDGNGYVDDVHGWDFYNNDNNPDDDHGHGTHCAGTIGARGNNATGVTGVNWTVKMVGLKFLNSSGSGPTSAAAAAVNYCIGKGIKISNNSWGGGGFSTTLFNAIQASQSIGHVFVAAAGNSNLNNDSFPHYPSSYNLDNIIAVAATDRTDARSSFSNYGATSVDLGAPGTQIGSTYIGNGYVYMSGTSMACPHVTGAVAMLSGYRTDYSWSQIKQGILSTVRPTSAMAGVTVTGGVLNLKAMLDAATSTPVNTAPTVTISAPASGSTVTQGDSVTFTGSASDTQDGNLSANLTWSSNLDGSIGSGASFSTSSLSVGTHTVTASVTDSGGLTGSSSVTVTVEEASVPNTAPTVTISSPAGGSTFTQGDSVSFNGSATDNEDGSLSANLTWTSDLDGSIGNGASFSTSSLSVGTHTITASVTDSGGLTGSSSITVTVNAPSAGDMSVTSVTYSTSGGRDGKKHLQVTLSVRDSSNQPVSGASVSIVLSNGNGGTWTLSGSTGSDGNVTFQLNNAPAGFYTTTVTSVTASGLTWDGVTPPNGFQK